MFRQRYAVYVQGRKWNGLNDLDGIERDVYDRDDTTYLILLEENGKVVGGARLLPTMKPHLFRDHFTHLAQAGGVPRGTDIAELTRFYIAPDYRAPRLQYWLTGVLACGLFEYCLENGIHQLVSVIDTFLLNQMLEAGWAVRPLGLPQSYGQGTALGIVVDVTDDGLAATRRVRGVATRVFATTRAPVAPLSMTEARQASRLALAGH
jgi:acyl-homoserine lactone synthase